MVSEPVWGPPPELLVSEVGRWFVTELKCSEPGPGILSFPLLAWGHGSFTWPGLSFPRGTCSFGSF